MNRYGNLKVFSNGYVCLWHIEPNVLVFLDSGEDFLTLLKPYTPQAALGKQSWVLCLLRAA
jgi:hypothetical protein